MSTEAIIALLALFIACVPGVRFLVSHRQRITQWWNRARDNYEFGNESEHLPISNAQYNIYSTAQSNPSHTRINRNNLPPNGPWLPVSTLETYYPTLPLNNPIFSPPSHREIRIINVSQTTQVLAGPGKIDTHLP
ncbi:uncharacterized protein EURHEDRAFT_403299 [Aspergillus ruber CBS 135680]|uniref:Uncharacterized protein n=1 Tax=Aspergillus ruber (strain CBS 135680) TaxID=1388766 RepID=A0A017SD81_ASPRC|nr:uncharacterized protein EURHEDRAFT_403299 [Aspergillus ruber CBS 135680]EYE94761.1 hypothetical protein EURHEDRAFT_403299 [Aspergillus ruber CBS 135680]